MYDTHLQDFVRSRPIEELKQIMQHVIGKYPKCFYEDFYARQPLADSVLDQLAQREGWTIETAAAVLKFYHWPFQFRSRFKAGLSLINLDGRVEGKLSDEDARQVREDAMRRIEQNKERHKVASKNRSSIPATMLPIVKPPENPAMSIILGVKHLKAKLLADAREIEARIQDTFPEELIELFPDLERSISKLMEGAQEIIEYCDTERRIRSGLLDAAE